MHELAICQALMTQVESLAEQHDAVGVAAIVIGIGPLSGVESELLRNAYPVASAGTIAENAELVIDDLPLRVSCEQCGTESEVRPNKMLCPVCGNWQTELVCGDELMLLRVELEKPETASTTALH